MHDIYFDRIVQEKLQAWKVPLNDADWGDMATRLNQSFYELVKSRLQNLELSPESAEWESLANELDLAFDQEIRQYLHTLALPYESNDWPLMASQLSEEPIDKAILQKLEGLAVPLENSAWSTMAGMLDDHPLDSSLREQLTAAAETFQESDWDLFEAHQEFVFDEQIAEKLTAHEVPLASADWEEMISVLDGNSLDTYLRDQLTSYTLPLFQPDWAEMESQLEGPFDEAVKAKLSTLEFTPSREDWRAFALALPQPVGLIPLWQRGVAAAVVLLLLIWGGNALVKRNGEKNQPLLAKTSPILIPASGEPDTASQLEKEGPKSTDQLAQDFSASSIQNPTNRYSAVQEVSPIEPQQPPLLSISLSESEANIPLLSQVEKQEPALPKEKKERAWSIKKMDGLALAFPFEQERGLDLLDPMDDRARPEIRLSLYGATTRTKAELNDAIQEIGYTSGIRLGMHIRGDWSVVSGFLYGNKRFTHEYPVIQDNFVGTGKVDGQLTVIEVPLLIRYEFPDIENAILYGQAGMVTLVSIEENYEDRNPTSPINAATLSRRVDPDLLEAETHTWNLNTYPGNIHLALGVRYVFNKQLSIEVEPYFQQSLQKTKGSNALNYRKKLYTSGIGFGLNYTIGGSDPKK
jgi:hypothetical protein